MKDFVFGILFTLGSLVGLAIILFFEGFVATWLWNAIMTVKFGFPEFGFWEMYGLMWLIHFLFPSTTVHKEK